MHPVLVIILSALAGGALLVLALAIESWYWRHDTKVRLTLPGWGGNIWSRALTVIIVLIGLGTLFTLGYVLSHPVVGEGFTEFYLLGSSDKAANYPGSLKVGEGGEVRVGIINHEYETVTYRIEVQIDGVKNNEVGPLTIEHNKQWEGSISFTPVKAGDAQKVEFLLYRQDQNEIYRSLYLWVNVS